MLGRCIAKLYLWRLNRATGYWVKEREVARDTAQDWLEVFERDHPGETFRVSLRRPR